MTAPLSLTVILEAISAFVATHIDDLVILWLFFAQVNAVFRPIHVVSGAYWGLVALVAVSLVGFLGGLVISPAWMGLLGILPILLGIRQWLQPPAEHPEIQTISDKSSENVKRYFEACRWLPHPQVYPVALVTFVNGGDNIGVYVPLFASSGSMALVVILLIFLVLKGVWCYAAYHLSRNPQLANGLAHYGNAFVPFVLIALGCFLIWKNGTLALFDGIV